MRLIYILALMLLPTLAFSQEEAFYIEYENDALETVIADIEKLFNVHFSYKNNYLASNNITIKRRKITLKAVLKLLEDKTNLSFKIVSERYVIVNEKNDVSSKTIALDDVMLKSYLTKGINKNSDGSFKIIPKDIGILPGLTESDVLESVQLLPGVTSPNETASSFFVRGGYADQNRVIWDGINIYHKGHLFGMISPINPNVSSEIIFINKGTHVRYGERISSVIDIKSHSEIVNTTKAELGVNGINYDAVLHLPILKDKLSLQASFRRNYTNLISTFTFNQLADKVFENTKISEDNNGTNDFSFLDYNFKLNFKPNKKHTLFASIINIDNNLDYLLNEIESNRNLNDVLTIRNTGYSLGWNINWNSNLQQTTQLFFSDYALDYNFITSEANTQISLFEKRNTIFDSGISTEFKYNYSNSLSFDAGYQYNLKDVSYGFVNTTNVNLILDADDAIVQTNTLFFNTNLKTKNAFSVSIGIRGSYFNELNSFKLEPRLLLNKSLSNKFKIQASAELKNQIISEIDETVFSDLSLENRVWRLSNQSNSPIINSQHASLGFIYKLGDISIDADVYVKKLKNISALSLGFLNTDNFGFNIGKQDVIGSDVFLKKRFKNFTSWISYSFNKSKSKFPNLNNNTSFNSRTSITHSISTALNYKVNDFKFSLGWKWRTGRPFTVSETQNEELVFNDGINSRNLPVYHRLDFSSTYSFNFSESNNLKGKVGISIRNLYGRRNLISREYRGNNSLNDTVELIDRVSLGFTPNVMFRLYWK